MHCWLLRSQCSEWSLIYTTATPACFSKWGGGSRDIEKISFSDLIRSDVSCLNSNQVSHAICILNISYALVSLSASNLGYFFPDSMFLNVLFLIYKKLMFYRNAGYFIFKKFCHIIKWVKFAVSCKLFMLCCGS